MYDRAGLRDRLPPWPSQHDPGRAPAGPCVPTEGLPVKNTFVHFPDTEDDLGSDRVPSIWLPSMSSSAGSRLRSCSEGATPSECSPSIASSGSSRGVSRATLVSRQSRAPGPLSMQKLTAGPSGEVYSGIQNPLQGHIVETVVSARSLVLQTPEQLPPDVLQNIPRDSSGQLTSVGSIAHADSSCSPCAYWFKGVCAHGVACRHCHLVHDGQKRKRLRPSKQARQRIRKRQGRDGSDGAESDEDINATEDEHVDGEPPQAIGKSNFKLSL